MAKLDSADQQYLVRYIQGEAPSPAPPARPAACPALSASPPPPFAC